MTRLLRVWLVLVFLANVAGMANLALEGERIRAAHPKLTGELVATLHVCGVVSLIAVVCLWRWRPIGVALITAAYAVMLLVNLRYEAPLAHTLLGPIGLAVLFALLWPVRGRFRSRGGR